MSVVAEIDVVTQVGILEHLIVGGSIEGVAKRHGLATATVQALAEAAGWPDPVKMRRSKVELKAALKKIPRMPFGPPARKVAAPRQDPPAAAKCPAPETPATERAPEDHPAVAVVQRLSLAARDRDQRLIGALLAGFDTEGLKLLAITMAAMLQPDADVAGALEWHDLPPAEWSWDTLWREVGRFKHGAKDGTAKSAAAEADRRATEAAE